LPQVDITHPAGEAGFGGTWISGVYPDSLMAGEAKPCLSEENHG
jgi:hypothetical protein